MRGDEASIRVHRQERDSETGLDLFASPGAVMPSDSGQSFPVTYTYEIAGEQSETLTNPRIEMLPSLDVKITARPLKPTLTYSR